MPRLLESAREREQWDVGSYEHNLEVGASDDPLSDREELAHHRECLAALLFKERVIDYLDKWEAMMDCHPFGGEPEIVSGRKRAAEIRALLDA